MKCEKMILKQFNIYFKDNLFLVYWEWRSYKGNGKNNVVMEHLEIPKSEFADFLEKFITTFNTGHVNSCKEQIVTLEFSDNTVHKIIPDYSKREFDVEKFKKNLKINEKYHINQSMENIIRQVIKKSRQKKLDIFQTADLFVQEVKEQYKREMKPDRVFKITRKHKGKSIHVGYRYVKYLPTPYPPDSYGEDATVDLVDIYSTKERKTVKFLYLNRDEHMKMLREIFKYVDVDYNDAHFVPIASVMTGWCMKLNTPSKEWNELARELDKKMLKQITDKQYQQKEMLI